jgi:hypothetical protein
MSYTITTKKGVNYDSKSKGKHTSHVVGYISKYGYLRYEAYEFTIGNETDGGLPIIQAKILGGTSNNYTTTNCSHMEGTVLQVYFAIVKKPSDTTTTITQSFNEKEEYGTVELVAKEYPRLKFTKDCYLDPGNYYLFIYTRSGTFGWRYFPNTDTGIEFGLDAEYISYTSCISPTANSIKFSPTIQKPGGEVGITWDKGEDGSANPIQYYTF